MKKSISLHTHTHKNILFIHKQKYKSNKLENIAFEIGVIVVICGRIIIIFTFDWIFMHHNFGENWLCRFLFVNMALKCQKKLIFRKPMNECDAMRCESIWYECLYDTYMCTHTLNFRLPGGICIYIFSFSVCVYFCCLMDFKRTKLDCKHIYFVHWNRKQSYFIKCYLHFHLNSVRMVYTNTRTVLCCAALRCAMWYIGISLQKMIRSRRQMHMHTLSMP